MMILTIDEIIRLHTTLTERTGGSDGLRDRGLLESAVYSAETSFAGQEIYPTIEEKAARLMFALVSNHPFVDGNKRIGVLVMLVTLRLNGIALRYTQSDLIKLGLSAASGKLDYDAIYGWLTAHQL